MSFGLICNGNRSFFRQWCLEFYTVFICSCSGNLDGELVRMESSETPTRSYVINFEHNEDYLESVRRNSDRQMSEIIDEVLDRVIE